MRQHLVFLIAAHMTVVACESSPKGSNTPPVEASKEKVAEPASPAAPSSTALIDVEAQPMFVAKLVGNEQLSVMHPSEYCLDDGKLYTGARFRLGTVNVFGIDGELAAINHTSIVAVAGETKTGLDSMLREKGPCPKDYEPMRVQMKDEWVAPEGGPITTRAKLADLTYVVGSTARAVSMAEFLPGDEANVSVRLRNPFSLPLGGLRFLAHYEGGGKKRMPTMVEKALSLAPGVSVEIQLPRMLDNESARSKAGSGARSKAGSELHSLRLQGRLGMAELDIEISVPYS